MLKSLGRRHVSYGVSDAHYAVVGTALRDTLAHALGDEFDAETHAPWAAAYDLLSSVMKIGAAEVLPANSGG